MSTPAAHPLLLELASAWQRRDVRWTLLRVPARPAAPTGDVDVLVAPGDWSALREAAVESGFVPLPGWDSLSNLMLVRYDRASDCWLVLDVVTSIGFRRAPAWSGDELAAHVLAGRRDAGGLMLPEEGDAFWLTLLHCLLDKGAVDERYRDELRWLASGAGRPAIMASAVGAVAGYWRDALVSVVEAGRWELLEDVGRRLARELRGRSGVRRRLLALARRVVETVRKPVLVRRRRGVSVALLGPNGVGKSTLAANLTDAFPFGARVVYMGVWKHAGGGRARQVAEILARPFRLWASYLSAQRHVLLGRLVVFDRYVYEAALPPRPPLRLLKAAYFGLLRHVVPAAPRVVIVDVAGDVAYARKQENEPDELERERRFYLDLAPRLRGAAVVDAAREARAVRAEVSELVWSDLTSRWRAEVS